MPLSVGLSRNLTLAQSTDAISSYYGLQQFDTFAACRHIRLPMGHLIGNPLLAAGMWYYQMLEQLR